MTIIKNKENPGISRKKINDTFILKNKYTCSLQIVITQQWIQWKLLM